MLYEHSFLETVLKTYKIARSWESGILRTTLLAISFVIRGKVAVMMVEAIFTRSEREPDDLRV